MDEKKADCELRAKRLRAGEDVADPLNASNQARILKVIGKSETELKEEIKPKVSHPNQTNPIYKKLAKFCNEKIGEKFSIKDLLR